MDLNLEGKKALVVASSSGLGKAIAAQLVEEGADVMLTSRSEEKLKQTCEELRQLNRGRVEYTVADITDRAGVESLFSRMSEVYGDRIDIMLCNSGGPPAKRFEELDEEAWEKAFQMNLLSYVRLIKNALPFMKEHGGHILNLTSSSVKQPIPGLILSNTFRLGVAGLTKTLSAELAGYGILINTIAPGRIATDRITQLNSIRAEQLGISLEEFAKHNQEEIPLGRYGTPEEFAKAAVFLLSGANSYVTGSILVVDGGLVQSL